MPPPPRHSLDAFDENFPLLLRRSPPRSIHRARPNSPTNSSNSQHHSRTQLFSTLSTPPSLDQHRSQAENERLEAQVAALINTFHAKTRPPVASELENDMSCTLCSETFLYGRNPEVPVRLNCSHIFGMSCILKWVSPVSRNGNNSCPICRKPLFDDWDKMDFPAPRQPASAGSGITRAANPQNNRTPARASPITISTANAPRRERDATPYPWSAEARLRDDSFLLGQAIHEIQATARDEARALETPTPHNNRASDVRPRQSQVRRDQPNAAFEEHRVAQRRSRSRARVREAHHQFENDARLFNARRAPPNLAPPPPLTYEEYVNSVGAGQRALPTSNNLTPDIPTPAIPARSPARPSADQENINTIAAAPRARPTPNIPTPDIPTPAIPARSPARPSAGEETTNDVTAETERLQAMINKRKRYIWMQFREGVVRTIEQSNDSTAIRNHDIALTIINMPEIDEFIAERADESPTWRRILQTFPSLHTEMVARLHDFRALRSVNIDRCVELERVVASFRFDRETLHRSRWHFRLSERLATAARLTTSLIDT